MSDGSSATLVDSNVLIDVFTEDPGWCDWSSAKLAEAHERGPVLINPMVYAEVAVGFDSIEELDEELSPDFFRREPIPWPAAFLAGRCFAEYRRRGGSRRSPLPDFFIGAHAAVAGMRLLTRDATRYRSYFPKLRVIAP